MKYSAPFLSLHLFSAFNETRRQHTIFLDNTWAHQVDLLHIGQGRLFVTDFHAPLSLYILPPISGRTSPAAQQCERCYCVIGFNISAFDF